MSIKNYRLVCEEYRMWVYCSFSLIWQCKALSMLSSLYLPRNFGYISLRADLWLERTLDTVGSNIFTCTWDREYICRETWPIKGWPTVTKRLTMQFWYLHCEWKRLVTWELKLWTLAGAFKHQLTICSLTPIRDLHSPHHLLYERLRLLAYILLRNHPHKLLILQHLPVWRKMWF